MYLRHPAHDIAQTNEALRVRPIGAENRVTYKGPKLPGPTKTREEIEILFDEGDASVPSDLARLFENLGFQPVATVRKRRTTFHLSRPPHGIEVSLDRAEGLGDFAEIEAIARDEAHLPAAQAAVLALAAQLAAGPGRASVVPPDGPRSATTRLGKSGRFC